MTFTLRKNSRLRKELGTTGVEFLQHGLDGLTRILPHVEASNWKSEQKKSKSIAQFADANKRQLRLDLGLLAEVAASLPLGDAVRRLSQP